jgi:hypothetical protein
MFKPRPAQGIGTIFRDCNIRPVASRPPGFFSFWAVPFSLVVWFY